MHTFQMKREKLDDKGGKCVFLGISEQLKAYKLFNPMTEKIVISRDVIFDEKNMWNWAEKGVGQQQISVGQQQIPISFEEKEAEVQEQPTLSADIPLLQSNQQLQQPLVVIEGQTLGESSRSQRIRKRPEWMEDYEVSGDQSDIDDTLAHYAFLSGCDPITFQEAVKDSKWQIAMDEEIRSIEKNNTWELSELPKEKKSIGVKWVYKTKLNKDGEVDKYKTRLVAKGYKQEFGVDYKEVFAPSCET